MRTHLIHRPARDIIPPLGGDSSVLMGLDAARFSCCCCCGLFSGPAELGAVNPYAVHDHSQPACQSDDCLFHPASPGDLHRPGLELMLLLCAAYVFGCAFRSFLPRADIQRICLFDTWLSSVMIGRSVATVAEVCFAAQWAIALHQLGTMTGADTTLNAAWVIVPLILIAECFSWHAVLTKKYFANAIENSIWGLAFFIVAVGLCRLLPQFDGAVRVALVVAIIGIAGYLAFLATIDVPMYLTRWRADVANGSRPLSPLEGLRDASFRWV